MLDFENTYEKLDETITLKEKTITELNTKLGEFIEAKLDYTTKYNNKLITLDFNTLIDGRVTDAGKKACIDDALQTELREYKTLENDCEILKNTIKLCDDKISVYKRGLDYALDIINIQ